MTYYAFINIFKKQKNKIIAHETVQNQAMLFSHFFIVWIRINKVVKYGSNLDPDPQHCSVLTKLVSLLLRVGSSLFRSIVSSRFRNGDTDNNTVLEKCTA